MAEQVMHRIVIGAVHGVCCETAVVDIPHQQALAFQLTGNALGDGMGQLGEFIARRRFDPGKARG